MTSTTCSENFITFAQTLSAAWLLRFCIVGSFHLTWLSDLAWPMIETLTKVAEKMEDKVGENPTGGAARRSFLAIVEKPHGGGVQTPLPAGRRLTRALMGGGAFERPPPPPQVFRGWQKYGGAQRHRVFTHLTPHLFRNFCENFDPKSCEVRSPGQVKWPNYKITFQPRHSHNVSGSYETFGIWWGHQCLQNVLVYLGFLISVTSGQVIFATSPL